jgi:hypothetical protein
MRGEKTVDLGLTVEISVSGNFTPCDKVTIRAPGLGKFDVYSTMKSFVEDGLASFQQKQLALARAAGVDLEKERQRYLEEKEQKESDTSDDDEEIMDIMARGLGRENFPDFCRYVKKALTGSPKLAVIGEPVDGEKPAPINDDFWEALDEHEDGMDAAMKIMGGFTNFFFESQDSPKKNGKKKSTSSAKRTKDSTQ